MYNWGRQSFEKFLFRICGSGLLAHGTVARCTATSMTTWQNLFRDICRWFRALVEGEEVGYWLLQSILEPRASYWIRYQVINALVHAKRNYENVGSHTYSQPRVPEVSAPWLHHRFEFFGSWCSHCVPIKFSTFSHHVPVMFVMCSQHVPQDVLNGITLRLIITFAWSWTLIISIECRWAKGKRTKLQNAILVVQTSILGSIYTSSKKPNVRILHLAVEHEPNEWPSLSSVRKFILSGWSNAAADLQYTARCIALNPHQ